MISNNFLSQKTFTRTHFSTKINTYSKLFLVTITRIRDYLVLSKDALDHAGQHFLGQLDQVVVVSVGHIELASCELCEIERKVVLITTILAF